MKLCTVCNAPSEGSRCELHKRTQAPTPTREQRNRHAALDRLSERLREQSPFCEYTGCGSTKFLELDHIVPISEDPTLALEPLNCRVYCRFHNRQRGNRVTVEERAMVYAAIAAKKARTQRYCQSQRTT